MACGCTLVMAPGHRYTDVVADPENLEAYAVAMGQALLRGDRRANRFSAVKHFDPARTAAEFRQIIEQVV